MVVVNIQNEENSGGQTDKTTSNAGSQEAKLQVKPFLALKVTGTVKWFNVKSGYGFINRNDTGDDVFVHQSAIAKNNPKKVVRSVGDGETVEFDVVAGEKGNEAANVTGPGGEAVKGSPYAADRRGFHRQWYYRSSRTRPIRNQQKDGEEVGSGEGDDPNRGDGKPRKFRNRRFMSGGSGYYRGRQSTGDKNGDEGEAGGDKVGTEGGAGGGGGGGRGRGARGRRSRYPFRGGRGGGKPNIQSDGDPKDGAGGEGMIQERGGGERGGRGGRGRGRPRYRRPNRSLSATDKQPKQSDDSGKTDKAEPSSEPPKETSQAVQNTTDESAA